MSELSVVQNGLYVVEGPIMHVDQRAYGGEGPIGHVDRKVARRPGPVLALTVRPEGDAYGRSSVPVMEVASPLKVTISHTECTSSQ